MREGGARSPVAEPADLGDGLRRLVADNPGPLTLEGTCTYFVGRERVAVLDPGPDEEGRAERLAAVASKLELEVEAVCLTHAHADHAGCAAEAAARWYAPLVAGRETLRRLGASGRAVEDGDELSLDGGASRLRALATPGHSGDHHAWLWLPARVLFTGDLVLGRGSSLVAHPDGSVGAYLASLVRLASLRPRRILPGHGPPVEDPVARLEAYRSHRLEREEQVLEAIRAGAEDPEAIRERVYGDLSETLARAARLSILAHLRHLAETGHALPRSLRTALDDGVPDGAVEP